MFVDTHAHLTDKKLVGEDVLALAKEMKVEKVITSGYDLSSSAEGVDYAEKHEGVFASVGVYPCESDNVEKDYLQRLEELAKRDKVVAIGEIGLERTSHAPSLEVQERVFVEQLRLAKRLALPVVIHCRDAVGRMLEILRENKDLLEYGGTIHCFGENKEVAREYLSLGLHLSLGGVSTFKNARGVQEAIEIIPLDRILLETDCPYLAPEPFRGKLNSPRYIPYIAENIAKIKGIEVAEVERATTENVRRLFKI